MVTLVEALEALADADRCVHVPPAEVSALVERHGPRVRMMGRWNAAGDGSLDIPLSVLRDVAHDLPPADLARAIGDLRSESRSESAEKLIEQIAGAYARYFHNLAVRLQNATPAQRPELRDQMVKELFGG